MAYDNNNTGSLFRNERKQSDRHPDYTGNAIIDGKTKRISAWVRTSRDGTKKFLSLAFEDVQPVQQSAPQPAPRPQPTPKTAPAPAPAPAQDFDDDLPF